MDMLSDWNSFICTGLKMYFFFFWECYTEAYKDEHETSGLQKLTVDLEISDSYVNNYKHKQYIIITLVRGVKNR